MGSKRRRDSLRHSPQTGNLDPAGQDVNEDKSTSELSPQKKFLVLLGIICLAALFLRSLSILQTIDTPTSVRLLGDARGYHDWAVRIASGQWYGSETFYQAPLYPYFLALQIKLFGSGIFALRLFQALLGAISVAAVGIAGKNFFRPSIGLIAAAGYAIYPAAIYFDGIIQKTALASFLLCVLLAAISTLFSESSRRNQTSTLHWKGLAVGIILGLLMLTRENSILWVPIVPLWIWFHRSFTKRIKLHTIASYSIGLLLILFPIAARNASLGGEWSPTTFQAGPNFYIGNHQASNGLYRPLVQGHETPMYERADAQRLAEEALGRELSSREVSKYWFNQSWKEITEDPASWIELVFIKSLMVVNRFEVPDVECFYIYSESSVPLKILGKVWHFGILFPLAVWGMTVKMERRRERWVLDALLWVMVAAIVAFFILGRYRQPLVPLAILFGSTGLHDLYWRFRDRNWNAIRSRTGVTIAALIVCNLPVHDESMLRASSYMNMGIAAGQTGNLGVSIPALYRAIESHPEMVEAYINLGKAMEMSNRLDDAITCYEAALKIEPGLIMADAALGQVHARLGHQTRAIYHLERAIQIDPSDFQSQQLLSTLKD